MSAILTLACQSGLGCADISNPRKTQLQNLGVFTHKYSPIIVLISAVFALPQQARAQGGAIRYVDGAKYPRSPAGINAAASDLADGCGKVVVTPGTYTFNHGDTVFVASCPHFEGIGQPIFNASGWMNGDRFFTIQGNIHGVYIATSG